jgi:hypothetical protein
MCDWPGVELHWYNGQSGDTREPIAADLGKPNQLTVATGAIHAYWVRATLECGAVQDSPTLTFRRGDCGPTLVNQDIHSVEIPYGGTATLYVDPVAVDNPSYIWYQNEGQDTPVYDDDQSGLRLTLENVTRSGRYWVEVRNLDCSNGDDSYIATVRVASHPAITPPVWRTEVWTDAGAPAVLDAASVGALSYQWYAGEVGDERPGRLIAGATSETFVTPPLTAEARYWVRVFEPGGGSVDSPTMIVKICERPQILNTSLPTLNLLPGQSAYLDVSAVGTDLTYLWYVGGTPGQPTTATPTGIPVDRLRIKPTKTTTYWAAVTGHCGVSGADSSLVWAAFTASICPEVEIPTAAKATVMPGTPANLSIEADGHDLAYRWYIGTPGHTDLPIEGAVTATITTPPITGPTSFWCKVTSGSCSRNSEAVVVGLCAEPEIRWIGGDKLIAKGQHVDFYLDTDSITAEPLVTVYDGPAGNVSASTVVVPTGIVHHFTLLPMESMGLWARAMVDNCRADTARLEVSVCVPTITAHPAPTSIVAGQPATMAVSTDLQPVSVQWYVGASGDTSTPVSGGNQASLTVSPLVDTKYWARIAGCGSTRIDSDAALLTVCTPASMESHSPSQWLTKGATRELWVNGHGTDLSYRWYRGATGDTTLQIGNSFSVFVTPTDTTSYWARVSNGCGVDDTATIVVSVCDTPVISSQPASQRIFTGTVATLSVTATQAGSTPMSYQWYSGGGTANPIPGANGSTYGTPPLTAEATYRVRITAGTCFVDSVQAAVSMCAYSPVIHAPADRDIAAGQTTRLSVTLSPVPQQNRWYRGAQGDRSNPIGSHSYVDVSPTVTTQYWAEFTHDGCTALSRTVTVFVSIPTITQQPAATTQVDGGRSAILTVIADTAGVSYQWYSGTSGSVTLISGATGSSYVTPALAGGSSASYWVKVTGSRGHTVNSNTATVIWCRPATITQHPQSRSIRRGSSVPLTVQATGTSLRYQWYHATSPNQVNGNANASSSQYNVVPLDTQNYWVKVTSDCGVAFSPTATVQVCLDPTIHTQPASPSINTGSTATLTVAAAANTSLDLTYQWYSGTSGSGTPIPGATVSTYTSSTLAAPASYWVRVTSGVCSTDSATSTVSICPYPATVNQPSDKYARSGVATMLKVSLNPTPATYKWYRGVQGNRSTLLSTSPVFNVYPTVTTQYWGEFTHAGCVTWSRTMAVNVCIPTITSQPQPQTIPRGGTATMSVAATEASTYQWYRSGGIISGATSPSYTTPPLYDSESYWVEVTGSCGINTRSDYVDITVP